MIPVNIPLFEGNEAKYLAECVASGWISGEGPFVNRFEESFAARVERRHGVACSSGSAALDIAVTAAEIGPGDEVIMPTLTIISPAASIVRAGATPVLIDSDADTWNMDVTQIESRITHRTKAILVVHLYGLPVDIDPILQLAERFDLKVIEDAAEMHGQTYRGRPCGGFGLISTFSFYANKHVTCGEGGMVVTDDAQIADRCRDLRNLCFQPGRRFVHKELGWNYRVTNLQAAVGLAQLENLERNIERKRQIGARYRSRLEQMPGLQLPQATAGYADNIYWVFGLVLDERLSISIDEVMAKLGEQQIGSRPFFWPMHLQPVFQQMGLFAGQTFPTAERLARQGMYLPSGLGMQDKQIDTVCDALARIMG